MSTFYPQNDYRGYLSHHGIKGQKWGEQNGPPYPLSNKIHNMIVRGKQKRAAKRREKILHDPRALSKHASEFTKEEIDAAVSKIASVNQAKALAGPTKSEIKRANKEAEKVQAKREKEQARNKKKADNKVTKKIEKYAPDVSSLEHNIKKFNQAELNEAINRLNAKDRAFDIKMNRLNRPKKFLDIGVGYLDTIKRGIEAVTGLGKALGIDTRDPNKLTYDERHREFMGKMFEQGVISSWAFDKDTMTNRVQESNWKKNAAQTYETLKKAKTDAEKAKAEAEAATTQAQAAARQAEARANYYNANAERNRAETAWFAANMPISSVPKEAADTLSNAAAPQYSSVLVDKDGRPLKLSGIDEFLSVSFSDVDKNFF